MRNGENLRERGGGEITPRMGGELIMQRFRVLKRSLFDLVKMIWDL
jgi:hypothetical protein